MRFVLKFNWLFNARVECLYSELELEPSSHNTEHFTWRCTKHFVNGSGTMLQHFQVLNKNTACGCFLLLFLEIT